MKKSALISLTFALVVVLTGCGCEHVYGKGSVATAATCTTTGVMTYTCQKCNETMVEEIPTSDHIYDTGSVTVEASCTSTGIMTYTCQNCAYTKTEDVPITDHNYSPETVKESTYTEEGLLKYTCSVCMDSYTETTPVKESEVVVTVTEKESIPKDKNAWRFSDYVRLSIKIDNISNRSIRGVQGTLVVKDMFGETFLRISCNLTDNDIPANSTITITELYLDINQFFNEHLQLFNTDYEDLIFEYELKNILFTN